jgi:hypothetical protein
MSWFKKSDRHEEERRIETYTRHRYFSETQFLTLSTPIYNAPDVGYVYLAQEIAIHGIYATYNSATANTIRLWFKNTDTLAALGDSGGGQNIVSSWSANLGVTPFYNRLSFVISSNQSFTANFMEPIRTRYIYFSPSGNLTVAALLQLNFAYSV